MREHLEDQIQCQPAAAVVTGYGNMLARPLFREKHSPDMSEEDAMQLMKEALKACCLPSFIQLDSCLPLVLPSDSCLPSWR